MRTAYKVFLADDHLGLRQEIKKILDGIAAVKVVGEAGEGGELFDLLDKMSPDLVLLDISMPNLRAMQVTQTIKANYPDVKVIIMVMDEDWEYLYYAIKAGADGVLVKQNLASDLETAIRKMRRGEHCFLGIPEEKRSVDALKAVQHRESSGISIFF